MKKFCSLLLISFLGIQAQAANWYVRPSGGSGAGTSWTAAWNGFNGINWASVAAGDTVWVAGGSYTTDLSPSSGKKGTSGNVIAVRRARSDSTACTGAAGWTTGFDSTITQTNAGIGLGDNDFFLVSGATTASGGAIGWDINCPAFTGEQYASTYFNTNNSSLEWIEFEGPGNVNYTGDSRAISLSAAGNASDLLFSHIKIHKFTTAIFINLVNNMTFDYLDMSDCSAANSASWHPNGIWVKDCNGLTVTRSWFHRGLQGFGVGEGIMTQQQGSVSNLTVANTVFSKLNSTGQKAIQLAGPTSNVLVYNCTFYDIGAPPAVYVNGGTMTGTSAVRNCLVPNGSVGGAGTLSNNITANVNCFVNAAGDDFNIVGTIAPNFPRDAGVTLPAAYQVDRNGNIHGADGTWDVGAYEFATTGPDITAPTVNGNASINAAGNQITVPFSEAVQFGVAGGSAGWVTSFSGGASTMTYVSGSGTNSVTFSLSRVVNAGETGTIAYNQPGSGWQDMAPAPNLLVTVAGIGVSNGSTQGPPALNTATINAAGNQLTLVFSQTVQAGTGGNAGWALSPSGGAAGLSFLSGTGSNTLIYNITGRVINAGESVTLNYTQPDNGIEAVSSGADLASISNGPVSNNSTQGQTAIPIITLPAGPYFGTQTTTITSPDTASGAVIRYTINGSTPTASSPAYSSPISIAANQTIKAISIWSGHPNSAIASSDYEVVSWVSTGPIFKTFAVPQQTGTFTWNLSIAAPAAGGDAVVGIGSAPISDFTQMACIIQFLGNTINARNGGSYTTGPAYNPGATYNFVATINMTSHTWTLTVTPAAGGATTTIVTGAAFRTEQNTVSQLSSIGIEATTGVTTTSAMSFPSGAASARYIGLRGVPASGGAVP